MTKSKDEKLRSQIWRSAKTVFFLITMSISFLVLSAPIAMAIADALLPFSILSAHLSPTISPSYSFQYDFGSSLIDIPLISMLRSAIILCVYGLCDLSRGHYVGITLICSLLSMTFVSAKAAYMYSFTGIDPTKISLIACSLILSIGHIVVAYRTSCKERRKLLVYKIDVESISAAKTAIPKYYRFLLEERQF